MKEFRVDQAERLCRNCRARFSEVRLGRALQRSGGKKNVPYDRGLRVGLALVLALWSFIAPALSSEIFVPNFSFEEPLLTSDTDLRGNVSGWTGTGKFGLLNPSNSSYPGTTGASSSLPAPAVGFQTGYLSTLGFEYSFLETTNLAVIQANTRYTLTLSVGSPADIMRAVNDIPRFRLALTADGVNAVARSLRQSVFAQGLFADHSISFITGGYDDPLVGQQLGIRLGSGGGEMARFDVDNVRVDALQVPEPSVAMLASCSLLVALLRRPSKRTN